MLGHPLVCLTQDLLYGVFGPRMPMRRSDRKRHRKVDKQVFFIAPCKRLVNPDHHRIRFAISIRKDE